MFFGILLEITAVFLRCDRWCYTVPVSKHAAGIWCGAAVSTLSTVSNVILTSKALQTR